MFSVKNISSVHLFTHFKTYVKHRIDTENKQIYSLINYMYDALVIATQIKKLNSASHLISSPFNPFLSQFPPNPLMQPLP